MLLINLWTCFLSARPVPEAVPGHLQPPGPRVRPGRKETKDQATVAHHQEDQSLRHPQLTKVTKKTHCINPRLPKLYPLRFFYAIFRDPSLLYRFGLPIDNRRTRFELSRAFIFPQKLGVHEGGGTG